MNVTRNQPLSSAMTAKASSRASTAILATQKSTRAPFSSNIERRSSPIVVFTMLFLITN